jgi:hypothetical protein
MASDILMLESILHLPTGKVAESTRVVFRQLLDDLNNGVVSLSKKQRAWVEAVYRDNDLHKSTAPRRPIPGRVKGGSLLDQMPRPLKPPGKK